MSSDGTAIRVESLSKCYQIYDRPQDRLRQSMVPRLRRFLGQPAPQYFREFWALRDVSFEVGRGETVGIIGRNGSGKSTLLQIICGTLTPTTGTVETNGRVAALLELGAGFNPEFTGRENVYVNGSVLGLKRHEIDDRFDRIAAFADIGHFVDQPVKTYSSGMYVRLAFAVAIHADASVLIVDEALSVGDIFFQAKCARRLEDIRADGTTVLFVSHDLSAVERLCSRCLLLADGRPRFLGNVSEAVSLYHTLERRSGLPESPRSEDFEVSSPADASLVAPPSPSRAKDIPPIALRLDHLVDSGRARIEEVRFWRADGTAALSFGVGEIAYFSLTGCALQDLAEFVVGIGLCDRTGSFIGGVHSMFDVAGTRTARAGDRIEFHGSITLDLCPGQYLVLCGIAQNFGVNVYEDLYTVRDAFAITVTDVPQFWGLARLPCKASLEVFSVQQRGPGIGTGNRGGRS